LLNRVNSERIEVGDVTYRRKRAGSFPSLEAATKLTSSTLARNSDIVRKVARGEVLRELITAEFDTLTGREAFAASETSKAYMRETHGVGVVIVHDPDSSDGFTIISAYPRNPE
jgi:hypothetical protein